MKRIVFRKTDSPQERGGKILSHVRELIERAAGDNEDHWFLINRWVFARLQLDERAKKRKIKNDFYRKHGKCHFCKNTFPSKKGVHLHRLNQKQTYSERNCVLACRQCHEAEHAPRDKS